MSRNQARIAKDAEEKEKAAGRRTQHQKTVPIPQRILDEEMLVDYSPSEVVVDLSEPASASDQEKEEMDVSEGIAGSSSGSVDRATEDVEEVSNTPLHRAPAQLLRELPSGRTAPSHRSPRKPRPTS